MSGETTRITRLEERVSRQRQDINSNSDRVKEMETLQQDRAIKEVSEESKFTELTATVSSMAASMETVIGQLRDGSARMGTIDGHLIKIDASVKAVGNRVSLIENKEVDLRKILMWLGTKRGVFFMCFTLVLLVGSFAPDTREFILELLGLVGSASAK